MPEPLTGVVVPMIAVLHAGPVQMHLDKELDALGRGTKSPSKLSAKEGKGVFFSGKTNRGGEEDLRQHRPCLLSPRNASLYSRPLALSSYSHHSSRSMFLRGLPNHSLTHYLEHGSSFFEGSGPLACGWELLMYSPKANSSCAHQPIHTISTIGRPHL